MKSKIKNLLSAIAACCFILFLNACGEEETLDLATPATGARVKFYHGVPAGPAYTVLLNDKKWSSLLVTAKYTDSVTLGGVFPAIDYVSVPAGSAKFTMRQPLSADATGTTVAESTFNLEDGKYYMVVAGDTLPTPKLYLVPDARYTFKDAAQTGLRFINFLAKTPAAGYEFYLKRNATPFATLKYGESSTYAEFVPTGSLTDTVVTRVPGSATIVHSFSLGTSKLTANRTYNFLLRGVLGGTSTKAATLSFFASN
jgi:Domain of unknown function (DUF4397)